MSAATPTLRTSAQRILAAIEAFRDQAGGMPAETGEFAELSAAGDELAATLAAAAAQPAKRPENCGTGFCSCIECVAPTDRKPLTPEAIRAWWSSDNGLEDCDMCKLTEFTDVIRAVEAAHNITTPK